MMNIVAEIIAAVPKTKKMKHTMVKELTEKGFIKK